MFVLILISESVSLWTNLYDTDFISSLIFRNFINVFVVEMAECDKSKITEEINELTINETTINSIIANPQTKCTNEVYDHMFPLLGDVSKLINRSCVMLEKYQIFVDEQVTKGNITQGPDTEDEDMSDRDIRQLKTIFPYAYDQPEKFDDDDETEEDDDIEKLTKTRENDEMGFFLNLLSGFVAHTKH